ncbi:MAG: YjjG family noncanonical pyrimidine nucleotidase [Polaribacter sp.]|nr:YjjG family noncanonical pyrimidine nucleotidase [Polaribacter sp.]MDG1811337.1 YjjG family noncanonical pyrimidine nucleotidase [Polaribacter sp.]MDG1993742.1 YjjG family noncanonical pyrimidine nucleotidase [Polaribacter sp.]
MKIQHIFFDLDHTLWDFEKNSNLTFKQLFKTHDIQLELVDFLEVYSPINFKYWKLYRDEKITKETLRYGRLKDTFDQLKFKVSDDLIHILSSEYINVLPTHNHLFEGTIELLDYLYPKYQLHIITNGFEEVQDLKLQKSGIKKYFNQIVTSESVGVKKPNPKVFKFALKEARATVNNSVMVGDNLEADIMGALHCDISCIHFNLEGEKFVNEKYTSVSHLLEIKQYL